MVLKRHQERNQDTLDHDSSKTKQVCFSLNDSAQALGKLQTWKQQIILLSKILSYEYETWQYVYAWNNVENRKILKDCFEERCKIYILVYHFIHLK